MTLKSTILIQKSNIKYQICWLIEIEDTHNKFLVKLFSISTFKNDTIKNLNVFKYKKVCPPPIFVNL